MIEPEKKPYVKEIGSDLESLQHEVDGDIEAFILRKMRSRSLSMKKEKSTVCR